MMPSRGVMIVWCRDDRPLLQNSSWWRSTDFSYTEHCLRLTFQMTSCSHVAKVSLKAKLALNRLFLSSVGGTLWEWGFQEPNELVPMPNNQRADRQCFLSLPTSASGKEPTCRWRRHKKCGFDPWVRKIPWRRKWQSTPVFLPGESNDRGAWRATVHRVAKS